MSTPFNPLDKYRGFSTHHIMVVAHTTETIRALTTKTSTYEDSNFLDKVSEARLGEPIKVGTDGNYEAYLLIDSRKLSNFIIKDVDYTSHFSGGLIPQTQVISSQIIMTIIDPSAISFVNYLQHLKDDVFKTDLPGMVFLLKTIFVGHTDQGTTEHISSSEIPMILVTIDMSIDHTGGYYTMKFAPLNGSVQNNIPGVNNIGQNTLLKGKTIGEMFDCLQLNLNRTQRKIYEKINLNKTDKIGRPFQYMFTLPGDLPNDTVSGKPKWRTFEMTGVTELITEQNNKIKETSEKMSSAAKKYEDQKTATIKKMRNEKKSEEEIQKVLKEMDEQYLANTKATAENMTNITVSQDSDKTVYISLNENTSVYDAITTIMHMCPAVNEKMNNDAVKKDKIERYKTKTYLTSDLISATMHYDILEQTIVNIDNVTNSSNKTDAFAAYFKKSDKNPDERVPINSIEFDYIFSGKNTDVINLDIKINNAQILLMNQDKLSEQKRRDPNVGQTDQKSKEDENLEIEKKETNVTIPKNGLILPTTKTKDEMSAHASIPQGNEVLHSGKGDLAKLKQESLNVLSDLHGMSSIDTKMTIRGNPDLLNLTMAYSEVLPHVKMNNINDKSIENSNTFNVSDEEVYKRALENQLINLKNNPIGKLDIALFPLFCKVNIFGPNVDIFGESVTGAYSKKFWYNGWYYIREIHHNFKDGMFTQDLSMGAIDIFKRPENKSNQDESVKK